MTDEGNYYDLGDLVRIQGVFTDLDDNAVDPTAVFCTVTTPADVSTTYQYGVDGGLLRDQAGTYIFDVDGNASGAWPYRWYSTGTGQGADENVFNIRDSAFD